MTNWCVLDGDNAEHLALMGRDTVDHVITDPPYGEHTHGRVRRRGLSNGSPNERGAACKQLRNVDLGFSPITVGEMKRCAVMFADIAKRWTIVFTDDQTAPNWRDAFRMAGLENVRTMIWVKTRCTPQFTGDRPAQGHELILLAHRPGRKRWNGGGKHGVYTCPVVLNGSGGTRKRVHTTQKPLSLMESLIRDFTDPGELILDPYAGSGTTLVAAHRLGRRSIGIEKQQKYVDTARKRLEDTREQRELFG